MKHQHNPLLISATLAAACLAFGVGTTAHAVDYTWGGGNLNWSDTSASGWNGGPPGYGDNATINSGIVTLTTNNLVNPLKSITIGGTGKLTQTTSNTWSDFTNLTLSGGTLESTRLDGNVWGAYQLSNTVTVSGSSASTISTNGSGNIFINLGLAVNISPTFTTFNVNDVTLNNATDLTVSTALGNNIADNFVSSSAAGLIKTGAGTMTLSANNIYTGGTTVNNGMLEVAGSSGGNGYIRGTVTVNSGAELRYTGGDGTGFGFNGGNKIDTLNINGGLVDSQIAAHLYGATVNMTGGELRVNGGVSDPIGNLIHWNNSTVNILAASITASITGRINLRGEGYSNAVFNVADGTATNDLLVSAAITQSGGTVGITKNEDGTMELTGTNSYLGATQVTAGKLLVNGDNSAATGSVTVASGATLGGSGTIGGTASVTGSIAPGNSIGTLSVTGGLTLADTSLFNWEIDRTQAQTRGTGYDGMNVTGTLTGLDGGDDGTTFDAKFRIIISDSDFSDAFWNTNKTWTNIFTDADGTTAKSDWTNIFGGGFEYFYDNGSTLTSISPTGQGSFSFTGTNNNELTWTAVPELSNVLIGGLLGAGFLRRRRKN